MCNIKLFVIVCWISLVCAEENSTTVKTTPLEVKKMLEERCIKEYSLTCLKLDLAKLVPLLSTKRAYRLLPGLIVESGGYKSKIPANGLSPEAVDPALDLYLVHGLDSFMDSLSLRIKVMDRNVVDKVKHIGHRMFNSSTSQTIVGYEDVTGRGRRKRLNHALLIGGMVSAGTLLALTMSAISAMAGKALLASILSLTLTLLNNRGGAGGGGAQGGGGGGGGGPHKTTYEIITHAVPHHHHHETHDYNRHSWAAEPASAQEAYQFVKAINPNSHQIHV